MAEAADRCVVEVEDLRKIFKDFWGRSRVLAVNGVTFHVRPGEILGLLGPNGSGKSTTIKIILSLLRPTSGRVSVFGVRPDNVNIKRDIGYLPEESYLYPYLSPRETLDFYGKLFDLDRCTRRRRTEELLEQVGLSEAATRPVGEFSKGMARRIGLAQALINDPRLVILDEPTSGLDPVGRRQVKDLMLDLVRRGKSVILSSHLLAEVEDVCDRVVILYNGKVRARGVVRELLEQQNAVRLTVPSLPPERLRELLRLMREATGADAVVDRPQMNLEQYFLQVIAEAGKTEGGGGTAEVRTPQAP